MWVEFWIFGPNFDYFESVWVISGKFGSCAIIQTLTMDPKLLALALGLAYDEKQTFGNLNCNGCHDNRYTSHFILQALNGDCQRFKYQILEIVI